LSGRQGSGFEKLPDAATMLVDSLASKSIPRDLGGQRNGMEGKAKVKAAAIPA
jgi:hypothetical protein